LKGLIYLTKSLLFWLFFFAVQRFIFIAYNFNSFQDAPYFELVKTFFFGFRLDFATICYLLLFPFIFLVFSFFIDTAKLEKATSFFTFLLLLLLLLLSLGNTLLYKEWQSLLSKRALSFLLFPKEVFASVSLLFTVISFVAIAFFQLAFFRIWKKYCALPVQAKEIRVYQKIAFVFLTPPLLLLGARGGFQLIPINESAVYFSTHAFVNHASVNPIWYLGSSIWNPVEEDEKYHFMEDVEAKANCAKLFEEKTDTANFILTNKQPNIVILVLESHTADVMASLGGEKDVCPGLDSLAKKGILFTHIYGSGMRTDQGLVSILSAFPAQPDKSIIKYTAKVSKLPSLYKDFVSYGYNTSFYYGGEIEFANIGAYLRQSGVTKIVDKSEFSSEQINSKWGAHDEFVLTRHLNDLQSERQPFFSMLLTLSNHEPFETPTNPTFKGNNEANRFRNTAAYTDRCLTNYFRAASKTKWYANTLFILVADHGHRLPQENDLNLPKAKHIPLLWLGEVIKKEWCGQEVEKVGNQQDIASTLLKQLNRSSSTYKWSKDLLNPSSLNFAYYSNENVLGWISDKDSLAYSFVEKRNISSSVTNPDQLFHAKAYLQELYTTFLEY
jgi:phosphoglycerol transferase MdoB-like AlkP superfamily enzyme